MIISDHQGDPGNLGTVLGLVLRVTAGQDDSRRGILSQDPAHGLAGLAVRLRRNGAGINNVKIGVLASVNQFPVICRQSLRYNGRLESIHLATQGRDGCPPGSPYFYLSGSPRRGGRWLKSPSRTSFHLAGFHGEALTATALVSHIGVVKAKRC